MSGSRSCHLNEILRSILSGLCAGISEFGHQAVIVCVTMRVLVAAHARSSIHRTDKPPQVCPDCSGVYSTVVSGSGGQLEACCLGTGGAGRHLKQPFKYLRVTCICAIQHARPNMRMGGMSQMRAVQRRKNAGAHNTTRGDMGVHPSLLRCSRACIRICTQTMPWTGDTPKPLLLHLCSSLINNGT